MPKEMKPSTAGRLAAMAATTPDYVIHNGVKSELKNGVLPVNMLEQGRAQENLG